MSVLDELLTADCENTIEAQRVLTKIDARWRDMVELGAALFTVFHERFGRSPKYQDSERVVDEWLKNQGLALHEGVKLLAEATLVGTTTGNGDATGRAKQNIDASFAFLARAVLLLRLGHDYLFAFSDLLRYRVTSATRHYRIQAESVGILKLVLDNPSVGYEWLLTMNEDRGKQFYRKYHATKIVPAIEQYGLRPDYDRAKRMAMHSRPGGIARGFLHGAAVAPRDGRSLRLVYQEVEYPAVFFLEICTFLRFHERIFAAVLELCPEINNSGVVNAWLPVFGHQVEGLWQTFRPMWKEHSKSRRVV